MKKTLSLVMALVFTLSALSGIYVSAASWPSLSSGKYCEITAPKSVNVYTSSGLGTRGTYSPYKKYNAYIDKGDACRIYSISSSSILLAYPTSSGYKQGYVKRSDMLTSSSPSECITSKASVTTYKYAGSSSYGSIAKNDTVYKLGTSGNYVQVIYTAKSGSRAFKAGWISTSDYNKVKGTSSSSGKSTSSSSSSTTVSEGTYIIASALNSNKVLDISGASKSDGANAQLWTKNGTDAQSFKIKKSGSYYTITSVASSKCIDVDGGINSNGRNVQQWTSNGTNAQKWQFISAGNGYYYIKSALGRYLDVSGGATHDGANVQIYDGNSTNAQKWKLVAVSTKTSTQNKQKDTSNKLLFPLKGAITTSSSVKTNGYNCDYKTGGVVAVYAPADGTVVYKQAYRNERDGKKLSSYGNYIDFTSDSDALDATYTVRCSHLSSFKDVEASIKASKSYPCSGSDSTTIITTKKVKQGEIIGYTGMTGNASGHHLHLEVKRNGKAVNPKDVFTTH